MSNGRTSVDQLIRALKGLAEPTRLRLLTLLGHGELTVGEVCRVLGQSQPRISRHLKLLTEAGFLDRFREQQCVYYRTPASGPRSGWVRTVLAAVDPDDAALRRDRVRRAVVVADRGRHAPDPEDQELGSILRDDLGPMALGELLDIGTGAGRMIENLGPLATRAVGIDLSAPTLRLARARVHGKGLAHCEFHRGDMYALPFDASTFDTVSIDRVLASAERPVVVLKEAARVLRASGRLLIAERFDDIEAGTGRNPLLCLRQWLEQAALRVVRLRPCDLGGSSGRGGAHYLVVLAQHGP